VCGIFQRAAPCCTASHSSGDLAPARPGPVQLINFKCMPCAWDALPPLGGDHTPTHCRDLQSSNQACSHSRPDDPATRLYSPPPRRSQSKTARELKTEKTMKRMHLMRQHHLCLQAALKLRETSCLSLAASCSWGTCALSIPVMSRVCNI
jgi:hypothetical protein